MHQDKQMESAYQNAIDDLDSQLEELKRNIRKQKARCEKLRTLGRLDYAVIGDVNRIAFLVSEINEIGNED